VRNDWLYSRAFVVQLAPEADIAAGRLVGRVEHVASTRSARFGSVDELLAAMNEMLADPAGSGMYRAVGDDRGPTPE